VIGLCIAREIDLVSDDGFCQLSTQDARAPTRVSLELDDLFCCVDHFLVNLTPFLVVIWIFGGWWKYALESRACDVDVAPDGHAVVAVLADDIAAS